LIHSILASSGPNFRNSESFINDIKQILCNSLLQNSLSAIPQIFSLSLSIFKTLILHFRIFLKEEISIFFTNSYLKILENSNVGYSHKLLVIQGK
jgi:brefeldin A-inhibited guanine nucleotide-exchange protein